MQGRENVPQTSRKTEYKSAPGYRSRGVLVSGGNHKQASEETEGAGFDV